LSFVKTAQYHQAALLATDGSHWDTPAAKASAETITQDSVSNHSSPADNLAVRDNKQEGLLLLVRDNKQEDG